MVYCILYTFITDNNIPPITASNEELLYTTKLFQTYYTEFYHFYQYKYQQQQFSSKERQREKAAQER